jgi:hypothetical protein
MLLLIVGTCKLCGWGVLHWHNIHTKFYENWSICSKIERPDIFRQHSDLLPQHYNTTTQPRRTQLDVTFPFKGEK